MYIQLLPASKVEIKLWYISSFSNKNKRFILPQEIVFSVFQNGIGKKSTFNKQIVLGKGGRLYCLPLVKKV